MDTATWRLYRAEAAREGKELGPYLTGVLADWCDYQDQERADAACDLPLPLVLSD